MKIKKYIWAFLFLFSVIALSRYKDLSLILADTTPVADIVWDFNYSDRIIAQPLFYMGYLIVQTQSSIFAQDAYTGELLWRVTLLPSENQKALSDAVPISINQGRIAVQTQSNTVAVFDLKTGKPLWNSAFTPTIPDTDSETNYFIRDIDIYDSLVLVSKQNSRIIAYDLSNGKVVWSNSVPERTNLDIMPENNRVYLGTINSIIMYSLANGNILSEKLLDGSAWEYFLEDGFIYVAFMNGKCSFAAIRLDTMENDWCVENSESQYLNGDVEIMTDDDHVYFAGDKLVSVSKRTGIIEWSTDEQYSFRTLSNQSNFLYASNSTYLSKINKTDGVEIAKIGLPKDSLLLKFRKAFFSESLVINNLIYFFMDESVEVYFDPVE